MINKAIPPAFNIPKKDYIGLDNSSNGIPTTNVSSNADGSVLERLEYIQVILGGGAASMMVTYSDSEAVEENAIQYFNVGIFDRDAGAIAVGSIDITGISATLEKSTGGGAFSSAGITQPTFSKAAGSVYCAYQFLAAEWQTGDMYKMSVSGITATVHSTTAYVPAHVWSNVVVETEDIKNDVQYLYAVADSGTTTPTKVIDNSILSIIMTKQSGGDTSDFDNSTDSFEAISDKIGAFTGDGGTDQGDSVKADTTIIISEVDHLYAVADGTGVYPASAVDDSIVAKVLGKGATASASTYDNQTDSLEMLSDKMGGYTGDGGTDYNDSILSNLTKLSRYIVDGDGDYATGATLPSNVSLYNVTGAFSGDGGAAQDDSIKASLDLAHTDLDTIITDTEKIYDVTFGTSPVDGSLASFIATGGTALGTRLPASKSIVDLIDHLYVVDDRPAATTYPVSVADETILAFLMSKSASPSASSFNNTTDSLEALADAIAVVPTTTGAGTLQIATTTEDLNQAASSYDLLTGTTQKVILEKFNLKMPTGAAGGALTYVTVQTDDATPGVIFNSTTGAVANLTSEADLSWTGSLVINVGTKIQLTIAGGAHGSEYLVTAFAQYRAVVAGGTLAA